mmetsp:Transcript_14545/g.22754  ORF Transcript_14545/g.22754 Transcript_14545/m.22754 type:complete len:182 (-) Transcript_14545:368-913(-)
MMMERDCSTYCFLSNAIFPILDLSVGLSLIVYGILAYHTETFEGVLIPVHSCLMGLIVISVTFYIPKSCGVQIPFYLTFSGRGFVFLFFGGFVLDPFGFTVYGALIGVGIILIAFSYLLIAILNKFDVLIIVLPAPIMQNSCQQTVSITLAKEKQNNHDSLKYKRMSDEEDDEYRHFDETI